MSGLDFDTSQMKRRLNDIDDRVEETVDRVLKYWATAASSEMKAGAPWTDRTGAARAGLAAVPRRSGSKAILILFHSVHYGVYLELRWSGRYAIIGPIMHSVAPRLMAMLTQALRNMEAR